VVGDRGIGEEDDRGQGVEEAGHLADREIEGSTPRLHEHGIDAQSRRQRRDIAHVTPQRAAIRAGCGADAHVRSDSGLGGAGARPVRRPGHPRDWDTIDVDGRAEGPGKLPRGTQGHTDRRTVESRDRESGIVITPITVAIVEPGDDHPECADPVDDAFDPRSRQPSRIGPGGGESVSEVIGQDPICRGVAVMW